MSSPRHPGLGTGRLLPIKEVADRFAISEKTVRRWVATGELPSIRLGRTLRISSVDLEQYIRVRRRTRLK
jgi:excisionase family DNA binding protein